MKIKRVNFLPVNFTYVNCSARGGAVTFSASDTTTGGSPIQWASAENMEWEGYALVEWIRLE